MNPLKIKAVNKNVYPYNIFVNRLFYGADI